MKKVLPVIHPNKSVANNQLTNKGGYPHCQSAVAKNQLLSVSCDKIVNRVIAQGGAAPNKVDNAPPPVANSLMQNMVIGFQHKM